MSVNIYDVAKKAGVSVVTVSRVINNYPNVRSSNREKVLNAMEELNYKPNAAARTLARGYTGMIGLITPSVEDSFMSRVIAGVEAVLKEKGMFLVLSLSTDVGDVLESSCTKLFKEARVDGILIMNPVIDMEYILTLKKENFPFVLLDQHQSDLQVPSVSIDNYHGGYQATTELIKSGARKIGHICGPDYFESSRLRLMGYCKALEDNHINVEDGLIVKGDFTAAGGYKAIEEWLRKGILPQAVFAADDNTAFGVLEAARKYNIQVPEELSIIGYDDHPLSSLFYPGISTVRQPVEEMARSGVELLQDIIREKQRRITKIMLKPSVILRGTTLKPKE